MNKNKWFIKFIMIVFVCVFAFGNNHAKAAEDKTSPKITLKSNTTEPTSGKVKIEVKVTDTSGINSIKWATGIKDTSYFKESGKKLNLNSNSLTSVSITKNGVYSFYAKDKAGNVKITKITITNIDTTVPTITIKKSTSEVTNKSVKLTFTMGDKGLGITSVKYLIGEKYIADFANAGKNITFTESKVVEDEFNNNQYEYTGKLTAKTNNIYTFLVTDSAGNQTLMKETVKNIDSACPVISYLANTILPTKDAVKVNITVTDEGAGVKEVKYLTGLKELADFIIDDTLSQPNSNQLPTLIEINELGKGSFDVNENGNYSVLVTDNAGNQTLEVIKISNIDTIVPTISLKYSVMNQTATITSVANDKESGIFSVKYLKGKITDINSVKWDTVGKAIIGSNSFQVKSSGDYSVLVEDLAGNRAINVISIELEFRAVWISYLEFLSYSKGGFTEKSFETTINTMFDNIADMNMNAVVVQIRPFGDAMYESSYFPWSKYISGTQGVNPGFDPLKYMVEAAHERGLEFHAWLNPYRVTTGSTDYTKLAEDNPARIWHEDTDETNDRNVLAFDGSLYYNPASKEVQTLITNGIKEIVKNYDVDGIHFDDYFYPVLGTKYETTFDNIEYKKYVVECNTNEKAPLTIADWRRNNINTLIKNIYKSIKKIDSSVQFGISPGGFINNLFSNAGYYVDIKTWLSSDGYIDYICPQIYWSFSNSSYPFDDTVDRWLSYRTSSTVKMYIGIATYKAGSSLESDWKNDDDVLMNQVEYGRYTGLVDGYVFYRYDFFYNNVTKPGVDRLLEILQ